MKPLSFPEAPLPRPRGTGAFWDYAAAVEKRPDARTTRRRTIDNITYARLSIESERAQQRWDNEGGNPGA